jgi:hypothetical protein
MSTHKDGPGLVVLGTERWYGSGFCGICGEEPIPRSVRWWDPDDGWRFGVLCKGCGREASGRGPEEGDYALRGERDADDGAEHIDLVQYMLGGDEDGASSELEGGPR